MILKDKRLLTCAAFVTGDRVCDVGTDHGYLAAELLLTGKCSSVIAADINEKPLASARATLEKHGLLDRAEVVLSDGLKNISPDGITDIVIAGMGGELIANILSCADWLNGVNLVLQPMTQAVYLRKWLAENGFLIKNEKAVNDGKHLYTVINAAYDGIKRISDPVYENIGMLDVTDENAVLYIKKEADKLKKAADGIKISGRAGESAEKLSLASRLYERIGESMKLTVKDIMEEMEKISPLSIIHKGDNSGLLTGSEDMEVTKVLTALDITCDVVREAAAKGANVIVAHHPVIFHPLYNLNDNDPACLAFKHNIACICFHSPLDMADGGINDIIHDMLKDEFKLSKREAVVEPIHSDGRGYGMICSSSETFSPEEMAAKLKDIFGCTVVRYTKGTRPIRKIAFCSGGAGSDLPRAMALGADAYITGDVKHDQLITAVNNGISLFDCGHYHTEVIAMEYLKKYFNADFPQLDFEIAESCTDPACYAL